MERTRVALVTGAAHGIGAAIGRRLHGEGWRVLLLDRDGERLEALLRELGDGARGETCDVSEEGAVERAVSGLRAREGRLDGLVCNAGIMVRTPLGSLSLADWSRVLATNLSSTFLLARATEELLRAGPGAVVTMCSTRAHMSEPDTESYAASKGGLLALTHALAVSLSPVRVNAISPGWIDVRDESLRPVDHEQHPAGRVGQTPDVASLAAWLLGPQAGFVTGAEFVVDGGMTRKMIYAP